MKPALLPHRRGFLQATTVAAFASTLQPRNRNDAIQVGLIGVGGRCRHLCQSLVEMPEAKITAVCDIYAPHLESAKKLAAPGAFVTKNYKDLLARDDVDAVLIATPDHWHVPITIDACAAGKDVYVEKPLTHNLEEGQAVIDAQNKHNRIVQVGMQQRSMPHIQEAYQLVKDGRIGKIHKVHLTWNRNADRMRRPEGAIDPSLVDWKAFLGNAPDQPFDSYKLIGNWRWFWDFGGGLFTDLMVHWIDVAHWFLGVDHPRKAVSIGHHFTSEGVWQTPDTVQTLLEYDGGIQAYYEGTFSNAYHGAMITFMGPEGTLYIDRGRYELHPERGRGEYKELVLGSGKRGADFYDNPNGEYLHLKNWLDCIKSRQKPTAPAEAGVSAASAAHLSNKSLRSGQTALWS
jgi:predicted dehydrogenase